MECQTIMAISLDNRQADAPKFQELITKHGCMIKTRLGLHQIQSCAEDGLIILQICGKEAQVQALGAEINALKSAKAQWMKLDF